MTEKLNGQSLVRALIAHFNNSKVILEHYDFGVYAIYFEDRQMETSTRDDLYESLGEAIEFCKEDYSIPKNDWEEVPDHTPIMVKG